jgi:hypothetical protein
MRNALRLNSPHREKSLDTNVVPRHHGNRMSAARSLTSSSGIRGKRRERGTSSDFLKLDSPRARPPDRKPPTEW